MADEHDDDTPRSRREMNGGSRHAEDPGHDPAEIEAFDAPTATRLLRLAIAKAGHAERASELARDASRDTADRVDALGRDVRDATDQIGAVGRTQEALAREVAGTLAGVTRAFDAQARETRDLRADIAPVLASRTQWGAVQAFAARVGIALGALGGVAAGAIKVFEIYVKLKGH